ncbi:MAG: bifunctional metallophosphatase/5'-nucleotidase [Thiobacillaceae bacterium]|jgi:5'-nucleotidase|nr:bifunctional metallophosphatase/5'-nucleotidase [Thiobacillaceae bacterium]
MTTALKPLVVATLLALSAPAIAAAGCDGNVTLGSIDSSVADRDVNGSCINELIQDEPNTWGNHGQFVSHVSQVTLDLLKGRQINARERSRIMRAAAQSDVGKTLEVQILTFGDFHGQLEPVKTVISGVASFRGGAEHLSVLLKDRLASNPNTAIVSAGDLIGATPLLSALFHDEPTIEAMNQMGLMINAVGNHEFDEGKDELLRMAHGNQKGGNGCHPVDGCLDGDPFGGADFQFLAANVVDASTGKTLFPPYKVMHFKGNKVAFIGMTLKNTPSIVTPSGVEGLEFKDEAETVNALVPELKKQGVESILVVVHEGGYASGGINACNGASGPIVDIVSRLDDEVDAVISGHTHQAYICNLPNKAGRNILVTAGSPQARYLTDINLVIDTTTRDVAHATASNTELPNWPQSTPDAVAKDPAVTGIINKYLGSSAYQNLANRVIGHNTAVLSRSANGAGESVLGDIIADAQLHATKEPGYGDALVAFMNPGGIRADISYLQGGTEGDGNITYSEAFTVQPFGNSLVTKTLTGAQIEALLEQQFMGCPNMQPFNRILQVSNDFTYTWNAAGPACDKVDPASIKLNGVSIDPNAGYRVTMNSFLADGGDLFTVFAQGTDPLGGALDLDALEAYLLHYGTVNPATYPNAQARIQRAN